ncbi:FliH/SctL family protein [Clostridium amazonitimonense]|uniref:FliH/SctL family protein n=1 Tax=Clostridium amazonitimonense TaxID=1499689 RepID=UPI000A68CB67|nr:FliH/SctL family protein [Clostridium amazonitimonense]
MPSLYRVIKNLEVKDNGEKLIDTDYDREVTETAETITVDSNVLESYESIGRAILEKAKIQREKILQLAYEEASNIEKDAYEKAYKEGYEKGYEDSYEVHMEKAIKESDLILDKSRAEASTIVGSARENFENYLTSKKEEILNLSYEIAKVILKKELSKDEGLDSILLEVLKQHRESKTFIIKCNEKYVAHIREAIPKWKSEFALQGDIFVIRDDVMEEGNALIEKDNGMLMVGIDTGLKNIKKELY